MNIKQQSRNELKKYFEANDKPTESQFAELIEGMINLKDDKVYRPAKHPLIIIAEGSDAEDTQELLHFYSTEEAINPSWALNQNPRIDPDNSETAQLGISLHDPAGIPRFFIQGQSTGFAGLNTIDPKDRLHIYDGNLILENPGLGSTNIQFRNPHGRWELAAPQSELSANNSMGFYWHTDLQSYGPYLTLLDTGKIGIGTGAPISALDVTAGPITAANDATGGFQFVKNRASNTSDKGWLQYYTNSGNNQVLEIGMSGSAATNHLAIMVPGRVGIGTNTPINGVDIQDRDVTIGSSDSASRTLELRNNVGAWSMAGPGDPAKQHPFQLVWSDGGGAADPALTVSSEGMVGIGTDVPEQPLVVYGGHTSNSQPDNGLTYGGQIGLLSDQPQLDFISSVGSITTNPDWAIKATGTTLRFVTQPWDDVMVLDSNGNVGIGTNTPGQPLVIAAAAPATVHAGSDLTQGGQLAIVSASPQIDLIDTSSSEEDWAIRANAGNLSFIRSPWETSTMVLDIDGHLGIGTNVPNAMVDIAVPTGAAKAISLSWADSSPTGTWNIASGNAATSAYLSLGFNNVVGDAFAITSNHRIGVGTNNPRVRMEIADGPLMVARGTNLGDTNKGLMFAPASGVTGAAAIRLFARSGDDTTLAITSENSAGDHIGLSSAAGNVGIGTNEPAQFFTIEADSRIGKHADSQLLTAGHMVLAAITPQLDFVDTTGSATDFALRVQNDHFHILRSPGNVNDFVIADDGKVGIGLADPTAQLHVAGAVRTAYGPTGGLVWYNGSDNATIRYFDRGSENSTLEIRVEDDANDHIGLISAAGNVGIGTTTPQQFFTIEGTPRASKHSSSQLSTGGMVAVAGTAPQIDLIDTSGTDFALRVSNDKFQLLRSPNHESDLAIDGAGRVGIGTDAPAQPFVVQADSNQGIDAESQLTTGGSMALKGNAPQLDFVDTSGHPDAAHFAFRTDAGKLNLLRSNTSEPAFIVDAEGKASFGQHAPDRKFEVWDIVTAENIEQFIDFNTSTNSTGSFASGQHFRTPFTAPDSGLFLKFSFYWSSRENSPTNVTCVIRLRDGDERLSPIIHEETVTVVFPERDEYEYVEFEFATPVPIVRGQRYGYEVEVPIQLHIPLNSSPAEEEKTYNGFNFENSFYGYANRAWLHAINNERVLQIQEGKTGILAENPELALSIGAANSGIHVPLDDTLALHTNGNERIRITADGAVGVGTNNPQQPVVFRVDSNQGTETESGLAEGGGVAIAAQVPQLDFIDTNPGESATDFAIQGKAGSLNILSSELSTLAGEYTLPALALSRYGELGIGIGTPAGLLDVRGIEIGEEQTDFSYIALSGGGYVPTGGGITYTGFTAGISGYFSRWEYVIGRSASTSGPVAHTIRLREGIGLTGKLLAEKAFMADFPTSYTVHEFTFEDNIFIEAGKEYTFELEYPVTYTFTADFYDTSIPKSNFHNGVTYRAYHALHIRSITRESTLMVGQRNVGILAEAPEVALALGANNTGFDLPAADTISLNIAGTEALRVSSLGHVGVGTNAPLGALDVRAATVGAETAVLDFRTTGGGGYGPGAGTIWTEFTTPYSGWFTRFQYRVYRASGSGDLHVLRLRKGFGLAGEIVAEHQFTNVYPGSQDILMDLAFAEEIFLEGNENYSFEFVYPADYIFKEDYGSSAPRVSEFSNGNRRRTDYALFMRQAASPSTIIAREHQIGIQTLNPSIAVAIGSDSTGIEIADKNALGFHTDGTERIRIAADGNIGIGVSNPTAALEVAGDLKITGSFSAPGLSALGAHPATLTTGWHRVATCSGSAPRATAEFHVFCTDTGAAITFRAGIVRGARAKSSFVMLSHSYTGSPSFLAVRMLSKGTSDAMHLEINVDAGSNFDYNLSDDYYSDGWQPVEWTAGSIPSGYTAQEFNVEHQLVVGGETPSMVVGQDGKVGVGIGNAIPDTLLSVGSSDAGLSSPAPSELGLVAGGNEVLRVAADSKVGINTSAPAIALAVGSDNTGLDSPQSNNLSLIGGGNEAIRIDSQGRIGIHTSVPSIMLAIGSNNTGMEAPGTNELSFVTGGTESIRIDSNGRLGLGTTTALIALAVGTATTGVDSPAANELSLLGGGNEAIRISPIGKVGVDASAPALTLAIGSNTTGFERPAANALALHTNGAERMRFASNGNIGIGATAPVLRLALGENNTGFHHPVANTLTMHTSGAERLRIASNGRVGIGTDDPQALLHVEGTVRIKQGLDAGVVFSGVTDQASIRHYVRSGVEFTTLELKVVDNPDDHIVLNASGNVGIGNDVNPLQFFTVEGAPRTTKHASSGLTTPGVMAVAGTAPQIDLIDTTSNATDFALRVEADKFQIVRAPDNTNDFVIDGDGNVGFGTNAPGAGFEVFSQFTGTPAAMIDHMYTGNFPGVIPNVNGSVRMHFTATQTGALTAWRIFMNRWTTGGTQTFNIRLRAGHGLSGAVLAEEVFARELSFSQEIVEWAFSTPATIESGSNYTLELEVAVQMAYAIQRDITSIPYMFFHTGGADRIPFDIIVAAVENKAAVSVELGKVGIKAPAPGVLLAVGANNTGFEAPATDELAIHTNGAERLRIDATGKVSLGGVVPTTDVLTVSGDGPFGLRIHQQSGNEWNKIFTHGDGTFALENESGVGVRIANGVLTEDSDVRFKENIEALSSTLDKLLALNPVSYQKKCQRDKSQWETGFIAQEVLTLFPDLVAGVDATDPDAHLSVAYNRVSVLAVKAIQEQQELIDAERGKNEALQQQLMELAERMAQLEARSNNTPN